MSVTNNSRPRERTDRYTSVQLVNSHLTRWFHRSHCVCSYTGYLHRYNTHISLPDCEAQPCHYYDTKHSLFNTTLRWVNSNYSWTVNTYLFRGLLYY